MMFCYTFSQLAMDDNAVSDADFAAHEDELQPVLNSSHAEGVNIVAIHLHMRQEHPRALPLDYGGARPGKGTGQRGAIRIKSSQNSHRGPQP